jgi:hypothetical protein
LDLIRIGLDSNWIGYEYVWIRIDLESDLIGFGFGLVWILI